MTRRIVIGGMARSGSTWLYNACRLMLTSVCGEENIYATDAKSYEPASAEWEIIKVHEPDDRFCDANFVFSCVRDIRDSFCSAVAAGLMEVAPYTRRGLTEGVFAGIDILFVNPSRFWRKHATRTIRYEYMMVEKAELMSNIFSMLISDSKPPYRDFLDMAVALEIQPVLYNDYIAEQSYLFGNGRHRQNIGVAGYLRHMPASDSRKIVERYADWFAEFEYAPCGYSPAVGRVLHGPADEDTS